MACLSFSNDSSNRPSLHKARKKSKTGKVDAIKNWNDKNRYIRIHSVTSCSNEESSKCIWLSTGSSLDNGELSSKAICQRTSVKISSQSLHTYMLTILGQMDRICHMLIQSVCNPEPALTRRVHHSKPSLFPNLHSLSVRKCKEYSPISLTECAGADAFLLKAGLACKFKFKFDD